MTRKGSGKRGVIIRRGAWQASWQYAWGNIFGGQVVHCSPEDLRIVARKFLPPQKGFLNCQFGLRQKKKKKKKRVYNIASPRAKKLLIYDYFEG